VVLPLVVSAEVSIYCLQLNTATEIIRHIFITYCSFPFGTPRIWHIFRMGMGEHSLYTLNSTIHAVRCSVFNGTKEKSLEFQPSAAVGFCAQLQGWRSSTWLQWRPVPTGCSSHLYCSLASCCLHEHVSPLVASHKKYGKTSPSRAGDTDNHGIPSKHVWTWFTW